MRRSMLFLPGNSPNMLVNSPFLGADAVIFDLEDAVAPEEKDAARILVRNALREMDLEGCESIVRINGVDTPYWQADLEAILPEGPGLILLPKTSGPQDILTVQEQMDQVVPGSQVGLMALIETALGVENAFAIACSSPRVAGLFLGAEDLTSDLQCVRTRGGQEIAYARSRLVMAARAAGIDVYDTPFTDVNDDEGAREDAALARALGFTGKAAISPRHVEAINQVFSPSAGEVEYAVAVMEAIAQARKQGKGAVSLRGKMIDAPIVARARRTLDMARILGLYREEQP